MTRKDYELIANAIRTEYCRHRDEVIEAGLVPHRRIRCEASKWANVLADALSSDNPRFDREKFLATCGVNS